MTSILIEYAVKAAHNLHKSYKDSLKLIIESLEESTGYKVGDQFTLDQIEDEMSRYTWS